MIRMSPKITATLPNKRTMNKVKNTCNRLAALQIRAQLPDHFEPNAQQRFRYKFRGKAYNQKKKRLFGHTTPLVFTGELKRAVLSSGRVTATAAYGRVIARGSRKSVLRKQFKEEIETLTGKQEREITRDWEKNFFELASLPEFSTTKTIRG